TMYPEFAAAAQTDRDDPAAAEFLKQAQESNDHANTFRTAAHRFGLLKFIENYHADRYTEALEVLNGGGVVTRVVDENPQTQKWICRQCSMIYDPVTGDPDSGIAPGTAFADIPDDWYCPICGATKKTFKPLEEKVTVE
ncbi:MAG: rubredoxin, partial [Aphanizomenon sp.]